MIFCYRSSYCCLYRHVLRLEKNRFIGSQNSWQMCNYIATCASNFVFLMLKLTESVQQLLQLSIYKQLCKVLQPSTKNVKLSTAENLVYLVRQAAFRNRVHLQKLSTLEPGVSQSRSLNKVPSHSYFRNFSLQIVKI